jgi:hypothetical protein
MASRKTPYIILEGARVEIDGAAILVLRIPFESPDPDFEIPVKVAKQISGASYPVVLARLNPDGTYRFYGHAAYAEKLLAKNAPALEWTNIPFYD